MEEKESLQRSQDLRPAADDTAGPPPDPFASSRSASYAEMVQQWLTDPAAAAAYAIAVGEEYKTDHDEAAFWLAIKRLAKARKRWKRGQNA